jgi:uncharacterized protein
VLDIEVRSRYTIGHLSTIKLTRAMSNSSSNLDLIRGAYEAFGRGDVPAVLGVMDENIVWYEQEGFPYGGTYHGPEAVLHNVFMKLGTDWQDYQAVPDEYVVGDDAVVALGHYSGIYKKTGKSMRVPMSHVWKFRDGKAYEFRQYTDTALVQRALEGAEKTSAA